MEHIKRIDEQLMRWITARPYGYKLKRKRHTRDMIVVAIALFFFMLDVLMYGWSIVNVLGIVLLSLSAFYEWRLALRLRDEEEEQ